MIRLKAEPLYDIELQTEEMRVIKAISPVFSYEEVEEGINLTVTDAEGTKTVLLPHGEKGDQGEQGEQGEQGIQGEPGQTPEKGVDYWTEEDKAEIVQDVLDALPTAEVAKF